MSADVQNRAGLHGLALSLSEWWALAGGCVLLAVILVNVGSVVGVTLDEIVKAFGGAPFIGAVPGDFELTELGCAIAAFSFLPYCQINGLNVTADIFTAKASRFWLSLFALIAAVVALVFAAILLWRMYLGMLDQREYDYTTAILQIPIWWAFIPCLVSLALLAFTAFASLLDTARGLGRG